METPTIGRIVHYYPADEKECRSRASQGKSFKPDFGHAALVVNVDAHGLLNLAVFDLFGKAITVEDVEFCPPGSSVTPNEDRNWCCWPQDSLERQVKAKAAGK